MSRGLRWLFVGQGVMGAAALEALADARPPAGVLAGEPALGEPPVAAAARARGLALEHAERLGAQPAERWPELVAGLDVGVCACWTERLAPAALALPAHGWLNLHPSALPAWRGADPVGWQLLAAPTRIGCSVHRMTDQQDAGPVVAEGAVPVEAGDDRGVLLARSGAELGRLAAGVLDGLARGSPPAERAQRDEEATWCPPPGIVPLVDPRAMRAAAGARVARAFSPEPGVAVATLPAGRRFAVAGGAPDRGVGDALADGEPPGATAAAAGGGVAIAFADRWVRGWTLAGPSGAAATALTAPGDTRLPRGPR